MTMSPRWACATCLAAACARVLERPTTKVSKVRRGSSGEPPSASCTAEIGPTLLRRSPPLGIMGLDPALEKARGHGQLDGVALAAIEFHAGEPTCVNVVTDFGTKAVLH